MPCVYGLSLALTVQGGGRVTLGEEVFDFGPGQSLITIYDSNTPYFYGRCQRSKPMIRLRASLKGQASCSSCPKLEKKAIERLIFPVNSSCKMVALVHHVLWHEHVDEKT